LSNSFEKEKKTKVNVFIDYNPGFTRLIIGMHMPEIKEKDAR